MRLFLKGKTIASKRPEFDAVIFLQQWSRDSVIMVTGEPRVERKMREKSPAEGGRWSHNCQSLFADGEITEGLPKRRRESLSIPSPKIRTMSQRGGGILGGIL